jgi:hypothetical protein
MLTRNLLPTIGALLAGMAGTAHAQSVPLTRNAPAPSALFARTLPLEQYAGSLSVATPPGQLRRAMTIDSLPLRPMAAAPLNQDTVRSVLLDDVTPTCNMPVFVRDSAAVPPMPVVRSNTTTAEVGRLRGCRNSLNDSR